MRWGIAYLASSGFSEVLLVPEANMQEEMNLF
jgi:hypothetical protein